MDINSQWLTLLDRLIDAPQTHPRGTNCYEVLNLSTCITMRLPILTVPCRKLSYQFMFAEAWWILSGDNRVSTISPFSKKIKDYSDNGVTYFGAYGPKVKKQLDYVIGSLIADPWTRQAVMTIWRENPGPTKDVPCTISVQFLIRNGHLHCIDTMRSSDAWLGWPYDVFNFSMLSTYIVVEIFRLTGTRLELGNLYMNLGSSHLYEENKINAITCLSSYVKKGTYEYALLDPVTEFLAGEFLIHFLSEMAHNKKSYISSWAKEVYYK